MAASWYRFGVLLAAVPAGMAGPSWGQPYISEIRIDQPGTDQDEYFEVSGDPLQPLADLTYIVLGDNSSGGGVVESATSLNDHFIPADGYFLAAESSFSLDAQPDVIASLGFENGDNVTHAIVRDFSGAIGTDLDVDDDGKLDSEPWSQIVDCVALIDEVNGGDATYCQTQVGPDTTGVPWHVYRDAGWKIGPRDPVFGVDTPGAAAAVLPVELLNFEAVFDGSAIELKWTTASELLSVGFIVEQILQRSTRDLAFVASAGHAAEYSWTVPSPQAGLHLYRLRQMDIDGASRIIAAASVHVTYPGAGVLSPVYPNPVVRAGAFRANPGLSQFARIVLYDAFGRRIEELFAGSIQAGTGIEGFIDGARLAPGVYFLRFVGERNTETRRLVVSR